MGTILITQFCTLSLVSAVQVDGPLLSASVERGLAGACFLVPAGEKYY